MPKSAKLEKAKKAYEQLLNRIKQQLGYQEIELARRAKEMKTGKWNYPEIPSRPLVNQWKEEQGVVGTSNDWKSFHNWLKTSRLKYRSSVSAFASTVFRLNSIRSTVNLLSFGKPCNV